MRVALDSNVLACLAGVNRAPGDTSKVASVRGLIARLADVASLIVPAQALGELFVVLRRAGAPAEEARAILLEFGSTLEIAGTETRTALAAADLVVDHKLQFWDSLIVSAAADAGCTLLLSEDMQHGFIVRGLTIINPLAEPAHPRLAALLESTT